LLVSFVISTNMVANKSIIHFIVHVYTRSKLVLSVINITINK
jgi:hypothetical protein